MDNLVIFIFRYKLCAIVSRFTAQLVRRPKFTYEVRSLCYSGPNWSELTTACNVLVNDIDLLLHSFFNEGRFNTTNLSGRKRKLENDFIEILQKIPNVSPRMVSTCRVDVKINLDIFRDLNALMDLNITDEISNDVFVFNNLVRFSAEHKGRDLPPNSAEDIFLVRFKNFYFI